MNLLITVFWFLLFPSSLWAQNTEASMLVLQRGGILHKIISPKDRITVGHKSIVKIKDHGNQLTLVGQKIGKTFLQIGTTKTDLLVVSKDIYSLWVVLKRWLKNKRGLSLKVSPRSLSLQGRLLRLSDFLALEHTVPQGIPWSFRASIPKPLQAPLANSIEKRIRARNLVLGHLNLSPELTYTLPQVEEPRKSLYKKALSPFGIALRFNKHIVSRQPMIQVQVLICQVSQRFFQHYGIQWPSEVQGQASVASNSGWNVSGDFQFGAHALEQSGLGKVLASPTLSTKSGTKANFHSGGEYPIPSQNSFYSQVQWKKHGILLEVEPSVDNEGRMDIKVKAEISLLDHSKAQNGIPAIEKSEVQSNFQWLGSKPIILSGLLKKRWYDTNEGLPLLRQIPILNPLFSHSEESQDQTELVFLIQAKVLTE